MDGKQLAPKGKLLVAEAASASTVGLHQLLQDEYQVLTAEDGQQALDVARSQGPDLILIDADMDGAAICADLQQFPETHGIPVILVGTFDDPDDEAKALAAGAADVIRKPVNGAVTLARVHLHLTLRHQGDQLRKAGASPAAPQSTGGRHDHDLEHFAHLAAHDLQAPLNAIAGFAQLLDEEGAGKLSDQARQYLGFIQDNTRRMRTLIQDLLNYSQLESHTHPFQPVNLSKLVDEVRFILAARIGAANATLTCSDLPTLNVDRQQIFQVLMSLIENAIKFNRQEQPQVHLSARPEGDEWIIAVEDNGIGIAPQHHRQIFDLFRRLHSSQAFPGSGIGLALCRRIVARHGGSIWVESQVGQGSTFFFTLPASPAAVD